MAGGVSGVIAQGINNSTVIRFLFNPVLAIKDSIKSIIKKRQLPENFTHLSLTITAIGGGIALPFLVTPYHDYLGGIINNIIQGLGYNIPEILKTIGICTASSWLCSYPVSVLTTGVIKLFRRCLCGDWDFRMSKSQCIKIAKQLELTEKEVQDIFIACVKLYRNPPDGGITSAEDYRTIIEGLLIGDQNALDRYYDQIETQLLLKKKLLNRKQFLEQAQQELTDKKRKMQASFSAALPTRPSKNLVCETESEAKIGAAEDDTQAHVGPQSPRLLSSLLEESSSHVELGQLPHTKDTITAPDVRYQITSVSTPSSSVSVPNEPPNATGTINIRTVTASMLFIAKMKSRLVHNHILALDKQIASINTGIGISSQCQGLEKRRKMELLGQALRVRAILLEKRKIDPKSPRGQNILKRHYDTLINMGSPAIEKLIQQDQANFDTMSSSITSNSPVKNCTI